MAEERKAQGLKATWDNQVEHLRLGANFFGRGTSNDIVLASDLVSRRHAKLILTDTGATVHDLDSHNGIFLNGKKVRSSEVKAGDRLYVANVCIALEGVPLGGNAFAAHALTESRLVESSISGIGEEPAARNLSVLYRAIRALQEEVDQERFLADVVTLARELTDADISVLIAGKGDGSYHCPIVFGTDEEPKINWEIVNKALDDRVALHTNSEQTPSTGSMICVPLLKGERSVGALWVQRLQDGGNFEERELETVTLLGHLMVNRWDNQAVEDGHTQLVAADITDEASRVDTKSHELEINALNERIAVLESEIARRDTDARERVQQLTKSRAQIEELKKSTHALAAAEATVAELNARVQSVEGSLKTKRTQVTSLQGELEGARQALIKERAEDGEQMRAVMGQLEELRQQLTTANAQAVLANQLQEAISRALPQSAVERLKTQLAGGRLDQALERFDGVCAAFGISGLDALVGHTPPQETARILRQHRSAVEDALSPMNIAIAQTFGHTHLAFVPPDLVQELVEAGLKLGDAMPGPVRSTMALHAGTILRGYFADPQGLEHGAIGEPILAARSMLDLSPSGGVVLSKEARGNLDERFRLMSVGLHAIRGVSAPVDLFQVVGIGEAS